MNGVQSNLSLYKETNFNWVHSTLLNDRIDAKNYKVEYLELQRKIISQTYIRLRDVIEDIKNGFEVNRSYSDVGLKFLTVKDLKEFEINYSDIKKIDLHFRDIPEKGRLKEGDIIITRSGSIGIAKTITNNDEDIVISSDIIKLRVNNKIDRDYLTTYLNSDTGRKLIEQLSYGAVIKKIGQEELLDLLIPIPSPEIQKYIGDKVRKAEELREEAKRLKKQAEEILINEIGFNNVNKGNAKYHWIKEDIVDDRIDSDFYDLKYQVLIEIEKKFNCYLMEDIIVDKYTGKTPGKEYDDIKGIPLIVVKNVEENILNLDNIDRRIKDNNSFKKTEENDLLITRVGSVGVVSIVEENEKGLFLSDNVICLKLKEGLFNRYIAFYLNSIYGKLMVERWTKGAVQGVINYESINKFKIPIMDNNIMKEIDLKILKWKQLLAISKQLIQEAKQDVEDLIEGNFDMSKVKA